LEGLRRYGMKAVLGIVAILFMLGLTTTPAAAQQQATRKDVSIFGITLGKTLAQSEIDECPLVESTYEYRETEKEYEPFYKSENVHPDKPCYREQDLRYSHACGTAVDVPSSFYTDVKVTLSNDCDRSTPVEEVQVVFNDDDFKKVFNLVTGKYGKPATASHYVLQNKMGARFQGVTYGWSVAGDMIFLINHTDKVDEGCIIATYKDKIAKDANKTKKEMKSDRDKF
jgi:hypothetical protein